MSDVFGKILDNVENKYYGKYRGTVSDNNDPSNLGRLKVKVPELLGTNVTGWALPCLPTGGFSDLGFFFVPEVNANVWVEFEGGNLSYPVWTGTWWGDSANTAPSESSSNTDNNVKVLKTRSGHKIQFSDDKKGKKENILIQSNGKHHILLDDSDGGQKIEIKSNKGHYMLIDDTNDKIEIKTSSGDQMVMDNAGNKITIKDSTGTSSIEIDATSISIKSTQVSIKATNVDISADAQMNISANAMMSIKSSGPLQVQGAVITLN